jgi:hypothetical protein
MRGRWAAGIVPRNFNWVIRDSLAVSERPGGYAPNHRRVRRQEEILWLRAQGFDRVVSLLASTHNLHAYDELGVTWSHFPLAGDIDTFDVLSRLYPALASWIAGGERILLHQEELGDRVMGVIAGYLRWRGLLPEGARAISAVEQIVKKQMETGGRSVVGLVEHLPPFGTVVADLDTPAVDGTGDADGDRPGGEEVAVDDGDAAPSVPATGDAQPHSPPPAAHRKRGPSGPAAHR